MQIIYKQKCDLREQQVHLPMISKKKDKENTQNENEGRTKPTIRNQGRNKYDNQVPIQTLLIAVKHKLCFHE